jgi:hypothetical protein
MSIFLTCQLSGGGVRKFVKEFRGEENPVGTRPKFTARMAVLPNPGTLSGSENPVQLILRCTQPAELKFLIASCLARCPERHRHFYVAAVLK